MKKKVLLLATGGTIASRYDSSSDDVRAVGRAADLVQWVREREPQASPEARDIMTVNSYELDLPAIFEIAQAVSRAVQEEDVGAVVVTHGTDTLEETAFMTDLLIASDKPVIFTGAQRSADHPYPDGPVNLLDAVRLACSPVARRHGVMVVFGQEIHAARWATKRHTSDLRAFGSAGKGRLGAVDGDVVTVDFQPSRQAAIRPVQVESRIDLIRLCAGADARFIDCAIDTGARGIVLEALGRGNATAAVLEGVERAIAREIPVVVTSRCPDGRVAPVYGGSGGVGLARAGALFGGAMSGPKVRILLSVLLGRPDWRASFEADMASFCGNPLAMH